MEARDLEYKAWSHVQSLKSSLDEQNLELRVKMANEAEAMSQQRLAAAEAEIADMRQKLEAFKRLTMDVVHEKCTLILLNYLVIFYILILSCYCFREMVSLSDALKSKNEEIEAYLSEIEVAFVLSHLASFFCSTAEFVLRILVWFFVRQLDRYMMTCKHKTNNCCSRLQKEMTIT